MFEHIKYIMKTFFPYIIRLSAVAALGGLLFGYDTAVIAGAIGYIQEKFNLDAVGVGWAASSAIWGCILGALFAGYCSDKWGRKGVMVVTALLFFISALTSAIAENLSFFIIARMLGGIGVGAASMLSPLYISEVSPAKIRGTLVSIYQLAIVLGINFIYIINYFIAGSGSHEWNVNYGWRYMLASEMIPALLFFILLFTVPESPRWLLKRNKDHLARKILFRINGPAAKTMEDSIKRTIGREKDSFREIFKKRYKNALLIGSILALFSQITGINAVIYYAPEIFKSIGIGSDSALSQTIFIGIINTAFTFAAIGLIDKIGRKKLLFAGVSGMIVCLLGTGFCFQFQIYNELLLICILGFIASFATSLGPIPWVIISEIFPTKTRGLAMSFCTIILWIGVMIVTQLTPVFLEKIGGAGTFYFFMFNAIILLYFTWKYVPETKGKSLEEIEGIWKEKQSLN